MMSRHATRYRHIWDPWGQQQVGPADPSPIQREADIPVGMMREYYRLRAQYSRPLNPEQEEEELRAEEAKAAEKRYEQEDADRKAYRDLRRQIAEAEEQVPGRMKDEEET